MTLAPWTPEPSTSAALFPRSEASELLNCFLSGRNRKTLEAYRGDLEHFRKTAMPCEDLDSAIAQFVALSGGQANAIALRYRNSMVDSRLQPTTINRRLAAIRSLVKLARTLGLVSWGIEIPNLRVQPYRDTRGPGLPAFCQMVDAAQEQSHRKACRDVAILRLMFDLALRASELTGLDLADFDRNGQTIAVMGKGKTQKVHLSLPSAATSALTRWIEVRGREQGALFLNCDRARKGQRLTRSGVYELIRKLGRGVGIETRPHGLRHLSITEACKLAQANGFGLEEVLDHSRHASVSTLLIYRDRERNVQGEIASLISSKLDRARS